jgi:hypothetical protein
MTVIRGGGLEELITTFLYRKRLSARVERFKHDLDYRSPWLIEQLIEICRQNRLGQEVIERVKKSPHAVDAFEEVLAAFNARGLKDSALRIVEYLYPNG